MTLSDTMQASLQGRDFGVAGSLAPLVLCLICLTCPTIETSSLPLGIHKGNIMTNNVLEVSLTTVANNSKERFSYLVMAFC